MNGKIVQVFFFKQCMSVFMFAMRGQGQYVTGNCRPYSVSYKHKLKNKMFGNNWNKTETFPETWSWYNWALSVASCGSVYVYLLICSLQACHELTWAQPCFFSQRKVHFKKVKAPSLVTLQYQSQTLSFGKESCRFLHFDKRCFVVLE